jgi:hypothetical protein
MNSPKTLSGGAELVFLAQQFVFLLGSSLCAAPKKFRTLN